jgi:hypothetical protein
MGYRTVVVPVECPKGIKQIPGIAGSTVLAFCNGVVLVHDTYKCLRELGVKLVWIPTMRWASKFEAESFEVNGLPDRIVYQTADQWATRPSFKCRCTRIA